LGYIKKKKPYFRRTNGNEIEELFAARQRLDDGIFGEFTSAGVKSP